jgi:peptidoglycan glycosyltransferase
MKYSGKWISSSYNPRLREKRSTVIPGSIYDADGLELAGSSYSQRTYNENDDIRLATAHVIGDIYGFSPLGVETTQGAWLLGFNEKLSDRIKRILLGETEHGNDITLTIDADLNVKIAEQFDDLSGAAAVINYKTGEIVSMVSMPTFDLKDIDVNLENGGADAESLSNRVLQGQYYPGELFKIVSAASFMENLDLSANSYECEGKLSLEEGSIYCEKVHGTQTFEEVIANYCECSIASLSLEVGAKKLLRTAEKLGFNYQFLFSDIVLYESSLSMNSMTDDFELAQAGLGEQGITVTPMHMAMLYGAVANGGKMMPLKLVSDIEGQEDYSTNDTLRISFDYAVSEKIDEILMMDETSDISGITACGTTAHLTHVTEYYNTLSWYAGYISEEAYPYSIAIVLEDCDEKEKKAKEIAEYIYKQLIEGES